MHVNGFACLGVMLAWSASATLRFAPAQSYPHMGLKFPCLDQASADPLPLPIAHTYLFYNESALLREDCFDPYELWYQNQCCARWVTTDNTRLSIGCATYQLPLFPNSAFVSRSRFQTGLNAASNRLRAKASADQIDQWVTTFCGVPVGPPERVRKNLFHLDQVLYYPSASSNTLVYAWLPRRGRNNTEPEWFCAILTTASGTLPQIARDVFEEQFMGQISVLSPAANEGAAAANVSVSQEEEVFPPDPVRQEARKSVENYQEWWIAETDGYIILSDADTDRGKALIRELQEVLPIWRGAYSQLLPPYSPTIDVAVIRIFQHRDAYVRFVGASRAWSSGVWMPDRQELVFTLLNDGETMMRTLRHELFHQYLSSAYCKLSASPWLNEGHACLFENVYRQANGKTTIEEDPLRGPIVLDNLDRVVQFLPRLIAASYPEFYDSAAPGLEIKYAAAWALVYYLQKGAPLERNTPFSHILNDYLAALLSTRDEAAATQTAFQNVDMTLFQQNFREFWLKRRESAMRYNPLAP